MKSPRIAIVILHYKNLDDTRECLRSLQPIDYANHSIIVVNNDTAEPGRILQNEFLEIDLIQNKENLGFSEGNNVGIRAALADKKTDAVLILNNDTVVEPNFLREMAGTLSPPLFEGGQRGGARENGVDMVAPRMMKFDQRDKINNLGIVLMSSGLPFNRLDERQPIFCPSGGCALYSRKLLEAVKTREWFFDPLFYAYAEDLDLGFRARLAGFRAGYAPQAIVYHKGSAATSKMSDFAVYHTYRNLLWTQIKNFPGWLLLWQSPWLAGGWLFLFALYTVKGRPGVIFKAFFDGVLGMRFIYSRHRANQKQRTVSNKTILSWLAPGLFPKNYLNNRRNFS